MHPAGIPIYDLTLSVVLSPRRLIRTTLTSDSPGQRSIHVGAPKADTYQDQLQPLHTPEPEDGVGVARDDDAAIGAPRDIGVAAPKAAPKHTDVQF